MPWQTKASDTLMTPIDGQQNMRSRFHEQDEPRIRAAFAANDWLLLTRLCRQALRKNGRNLTAHRLLGFALNKQREFSAALKAYRQAAVMWPEDAELLINYANVLIEQAQNSDALPFLEKVCKLRPKKAICWLKLAECCYLLNLHNKGFDASQTAAALAETLEDRTAALMQSAIHRRELGQVREAVEDCEAAIALRPDDPGNYTNKLLFMLADPQVDAAQLSTAARQYGAVFEPPLRAEWPSFSEHQGLPWRRLKVGFLSPDFRAHSVMYFVEGLLAQLDRRQFEVYAFHLFPRDDRVTERVQKHVDHFVRLSGLRPVQQAKAIREHRIDILIDLAGHTGHNGLLAMAHKAAPVQVSWLGFPATTGLSAVDYKFTDGVTDPPDAQANYSERLYRLPVFFSCYRPMSRNPLWRYQPRYQVRQTPAIHSGFVTFGSCNNLGKLTDEVLALWGKLLREVPGSRLLIEGKNLDQPDFAERYRQRCSSAGLDTDRLDLVALEGENQYLTYHRIDIALDSFPLNGGTTTFDVLWMGVPIVCMVGDSFKSRMGTGILNYLDRAEWLASTQDEYVRIACDLASDVQALNTLRLGLRAEMEESALMREDIFNHHFGEGLRVMWLQWLANAVHPNNSETQQQAVQSWLEHVPQEWSHPPVPEVGLKTGHRISLADAHQRLQNMVEKAKASSLISSDGAAPTEITTRAWVAVTEFAEIVLNAVPQDAVALACLAEVEHAHGHTEFAVTYLNYATASLGRQI